MDPTLRHIGIFFIDERNLKANRDKVSGILRYSGANPTWEVRFFNRQMNLPQPTKHQRRLDGAIIDCRLPKPITSLARSYVLIDPLQHSAGSVSADDRPIARAAADFLLKRGYTSLAFVSTNRSGLSRHARIRQDEFTRIARESGATVKLHEIDEQNSDAWTTELERLASFIGDLPKPCGLMACADEIARDVYDACRLAHVTIPDQLAVIGVDNELEICENLQPTLTSVCPDFERCGFAAARLLDQAMRDGKRHPAGKYVYGVKTLVERASTTDIRGGGRLVSAAMELIRRQATRGLSVAHIAAKLNCSVRLLEIRFKEIVGHSVKDEIVRVRLETVTRLLRETNRPLKEISLCSGWQTLIALQKIFVRRHGLSMSAYRARFKSN